MTDEPTERDERFRLTVAVSDEDAVLEVADTVDEVIAVDLLEGTSVTGRRGRSSITVDVPALTPKQWEAFELAYDAGYYEQPRSVDLQTLADELSISKSAVSQRLRAAEATILDGVLEGIRAEFND